MLVPPAECTHQAYIPTTMALTPLFPDTHFPGMPGFSGPFASGMMMADPFVAFGAPVARGRPGAMMGQQQVAAGYGSRYPMDIVETERGYEIHAGGWVMGVGALPLGCATERCSSARPVMPLPLHHQLHTFIQMHAPAGRGTVPA